MQVFRSRVKTTTRSRVQRTTWRFLLLMLSRELGRAPLLVIGA
jgi:hypothetical protein